MMSSKPIFLLVFYLLCLFTQCKAQELSESLKIREVNWQTETVKPGIAYKTKQFDVLMQGPQCISYLDIDMSRASIQLKIAYLTKGRAKTSELAIHIPGAIAAVNGTFFNMKEGGAVCFLKSNRKIINLTQQEDSVWFVNAEGGIAMDTLGKIRILAQYELQDSSWLNTWAYSEVMTAGPLLIRNKNPLGLHSEYKTKHPRTAVGLTENNHLILLTVDGRHAEAAGMTIPELTRLMQALDCTDALNLDGGGSTTLWIPGKPHRGVVNYPSDNKKFDHEGERAVANALVIIDQW